MVLTRTAASLLIGCVMIGALMGLTHWRLRRLRRLEARIVDAQELAMLRHHFPAFLLAWELMPAASAAPMLHGRLVAFIALCLDHLQAYDAAIVGYDHLIGHLPQDHPGSVQLQIQRAVAQLQTDRLTDADDAIRRLRGSAETMRSTATRAAYRLAQLLQHVRTNHFADATALAGELVNDLRPLGVDAAYGHALMALSYQRLDDAAARAQAAVWWSRATLLMPPSALVDRFRELEPLQALASTAPPRPATAAAAEQDASWT